MKMILPVHSRIYITRTPNTAWSGPFADGEKVTKTLNGNPNDGLEAAFNAYLNEYLEVYKGDADHAQAPTGMPVAWDHERWAAGLQSWKDYFDYLRSTALMGPPAGLSVARESATSNTVNWYGVYGATTYTLQRKTLSPPAEWTDVKGCDPVSTSCTDTETTGSQYAYRVQGSDATGKILSPWAQVAVFLSETSNDGYVSGINGVYLPFADTFQPAIQAGQGVGVDIHGFLSFDTSVLGSKATVLDAKLRLKQLTANDAFDALGACMVDIQKGLFSGKALLEGADFTATATATNVIEEDEMIGVDSGNWLEAYLDLAYIADVSNADRTQFRIYFNHADGINTQFAGWYSGESIGNEPQLIVQYTEPD